jgi:hypothetical protein
MRRERNAVVVDVFRILPSVTSVSKFECYSFLQVLAIGLWIFQLTNKANILSDEWLACFYSGRSEVYISVLIKMQVSWVMTPCRTECEQRLPFLKVWLSQPSETEKAVLHVQWRCESLSCFLLYVLQALFTLTLAIPCVIIQFKWINQLDATVSQVYYLRFMSHSTCFGRLHVHHQELTTALAASGFAVGAWW